MPADLTLNFRLGGAAGGTRNTAMTDKIMTVLREKLEKKGVDRIYEALNDPAIQAKILADITADARKFGMATANVMTRIKSSPAGPTSISIDGLIRRAAIFSNDPSSSRLTGKTVVQWRALTEATLANKRRRAAASRGRNATGRSAREPNTYFVDTGDLRKVLNDHLGEAFALLVDPRIVVKEGAKKVTVTLSIMAQASGREKAGVTDLTAGIEREETMFVRYLKRAGARDDGRHPLAYKLTNPRGDHRPFLQNSLAFWITARLPLVLDKSLRSALARRVKKAV